MDAEARLKLYADRADLRLDEILGPHLDGSPELISAMRYAVLAPGKRLRPALCMVACQAAGGTADAALDAGCALELVHCFSLIHDDLPAIDNDSLRRGRPTCHIQFGEALALLAGDALFALAFQILAESFAEAGPGLEAVRLLAAASGPVGLVGGEVADVLAEGKAITGPEVRQIHERKTGQLIQVACEIGAICGGADGDVRARLTRFGGHAGLAFQIADDLLNELSTAAALGKTPGSDRDRQKATYPAVFGLEESHRLAGAEVQAALSEIEPFDASADDLRIFARYVVQRLR